MFHSSNTPRDWSRALNTYDVMVVMAGLPAILAACAVALLALRRAV